MAEQIGPSTSELAAYRKLHKRACEEMLDALVKATGQSENEARALLVMTGLATISALRQVAESKMADPVQADLVVNACLAGYGWAGIAAFYGLQPGYMDMLDELNGMNVKDDNDLPPTKEKG